MPCAWPVTDDMKNPAHYPLANGQGALRRRRRRGAWWRPATPTAHDAIEAIDVGYEPLEAVIDLEDALSDRVVIHDDLGTNTSYTWALKVEDHEGAVDEAFAAAAHTVSERYVQQRLIPMAMEPRAVVAVPQPFGGDITLYSATQIPHILKVMSAITLGIPEHQVRVVAPAVGGGFGSKLNVYAEELLCLALARKHGVPVRWNETRSENALATIHGRGPDPGHRTRGRRRRQAHRPPGPPHSPTWAPTSSSSPPASRCSGRSSTPGSTTCRRRTTSRARRCSRR